jgi:hypothetical protein
MSGEEFITPETVRLWLAVPQGALNKIDLARAYLIAAIEVDRLRDEVTDRANVEADLRAQLAETKARRGDRTDAGWQAMGDAAELIADETGFLYGHGNFDYETVEAIKDWCHSWAAQFREHSEVAPPMGGETT